MAFKHCHSSHFDPCNSASSASVMMTQPELYLEASDMALCPSPSLSDRRFPEHLGSCEKSPLFIKLARQVRIMGKSTRKWV